MTDVEEYVREVYRSIGMAQCVGEITNFCHFLKSIHIKNVIEIGTNRGGTFYLWCKLSEPNGKKITIDLPQTESGDYSYSVRDRNHNMTSWANNIFIIEGDSHRAETLSKVKEILQGEEIDLLFIDGDHSYEGVRKDYEMYGDLVRDGGHIAFHDIIDTYWHRQQNCWVSTLWNELRGEKITFDEGNCWGGIGVLKKENLILAPSMLTGRDIRSDSVFDGQFATVNFSLVNRSFKEAQYRCSLKNENTILYSTDMFLQNGVNYWIQCYIGDGQQVIFDIVDLENNLIFKKRYVKIN